jgi:heme-degrading monooxygenase HmoA
MTFREDAVDAFTTLFEERKTTIRAFNGCTHLELWQDSKHPNVFFTYSHWLTETDLNHYRFSDFFKDTWARTKALFKDKPQAWSVNRKA